MECLALSERSATSAILLTALLFMALLQCSLGLHQTQTLGRSPRDVKSDRDFSSVMGTSGSNYMEALLKAFVVQMEKLKHDEETGDMTSYWSVVGFKNDNYDRDTGTVTLYKSRLQGIRDCNITRIEFLLPLVWSNVRGRIWTIDFNGQRITDSQGTVYIEHVAVFDLTGTRLMNNQDEDINIRVIPSANRGHIPRDSVLFVYCNIKASILQTFRGSPKLQKFRGNANRVKSRPSSKLPKGKRNVEASADSDNAEITPGPKMKRAQLDEEHCGELSTNCSKTDLKTPADTGSARNYARTILDLQQRSLQINDSAPAQSRRDAQINAASASRVARDTARITTMTPASSCVENSEGEACSCRREKFWVNLHNAFPGVVIVGSRRPTDIGVCRGSCSRDMSLDDVGRNITTHAVIMNLRRTKGLDSHLTCAAHKMDNIPVLTHDTNFFIVELKVLKKVSISSCRCV